MKDQSVQLQPNKNTTYYMNDFAFRAAFKWLKHNEKMERNRS